MSRIYTELKCGCYVSCDGGGGLIPGHGNGVKCDVDKYLKKHNHPDTYYCPICHPDDYANEIIDIEEGNYAKDKS